MVYRRTHQVVKRLAARRSAILAAARETAAEGGMAAVQIAPVAARAKVAAGTVTLQRDPGRVLREDRLEDAARMLQSGPVDHPVSIDYFNEDGALLFTVTRDMAIYKVTREVVDGPDQLRVSLVAAPAGVRSKLPSGLVPE